MSKRPPSGKKEMVNSSTGNVTKARGINQPKVLPVISRSSPAMEAAAVSSGSPSIFSPGGPKRSPVEAVSSGSIFSPGGAKRVPRFDGEGAHGLSNLANSTSKKTISVHAEAKSDGGNLSDRKERRNDKMEVKGDINHTHEKSIPKTATQSKSSRSLSPQKSHPEDEGRHSHGPHTNIPSPASGKGLNSNGSGSAVSVTRVRRFDSKSVSANAVHAQTKKRKPERRVSDPEGGFSNINLDRVYKFYRRHFNPDTVHLRDPMAIEAARGLRLTQWHLQQLKNKFDSIDIDGSGSIEIKEFVTFLGEDPSSPYIHNLFLMIDIDGNGTIEFEEYIRILATYCMFTKDEILRFCFESFDKDSSNGITEGEYRELIKEVNASKPMFPDNFKKVLEQFDENKDGVIDYKEFCIMESKFPMILYPAFRLQDAMQRTSLGENEWVRLIENYRRRLFVEEFQATHGGQMPPPTSKERIMGLFCCCFTRQDDHAAIKLGAELEQKHRRNSKNHNHAMAATANAGGSGGSLSEHAVGRSQSSGAVLQKKKKK